MSGYDHYKHIKKELIYDQRKVHEAPEEPTVKPFVRYIPIPNTKTDPKDFVDNFNIFAPRKMNYDRVRDEIQKTIPCFIIPDITHNTFYVSLFKPQRWGYVLSIVKPIIEELLGY